MRWGPRPDEAASSGSRPYSRQAYKQHWRGLDKDSLAQSSFNQQNPVCHIIQLTPRVGSAPEHDRAVFIFLGAEDIVKSNSKAVQVANVKRAKVMVEGVVQEGIIHGEVAWRRLATGCSSAIRCSLRSFSGRLGGTGEEGIRGRRMNVGAQIKAVWDEMVSIAHKNETATAGIGDETEGTGGTLLPGMYSIICPMFCECLEERAIDPGSRFLSAPMRKYDQTARDGDGKYPDK